jgi:hypothetical protein
MGNTHTHTHTHTNTHTHIFNYLCFKIINVISGNSEGGGVDELVACPPMVPKVRGSNHVAD